MSTKTLTITEKAYEILFRNKKENESFSKLIMRIFGKDKGFKDFFGIISKEEAEELRKESKKTWEEIDKAFDERRNW